MYLAQNADPTQSVSRRSCYILEKFCEVWLPNPFLHQPSSTQERRITRTGERLFKQCMSARFSDKFILLNQMFTQFFISSLLAKMQNWEGAFLAVESIFEPPSPSICLL